MSSPEEIGGGVRSPHDMVLDIVRRRSYLRDVEVQSVLGAHTFKRLQRADFVLMLLHEAAEFRQRAASYRNFNVGAAAWCKGPGNWSSRVVGHNVKLDETDQVNIHAEDVLTAKIEDGQLGKIAVLAVIGPTQEDHASGKTTKTLHPCGRCRDRLGASPAMTPSTLIVTARPDFTAIEFASLAAIRALHETGDDERVMTFEFDTTPAIFAPRNLPDEWSPGQQPYRIEEIDSRDYDETIGLYLARRYMSGR